MAKQRTHPEDLDAPRRLILARLQRGGADGATLKSLSLALGRNETYMHQFVWYNSPQKLDEDDRTTLSAILGVEQQRLKSLQHIGNTPDLLPGFSHEAVPYSPQSTGLDEDSVGIVEFGVQASSGGGSVVTDEPERGKWNFPAMWLAHELGATARELRIITIEGDSMDGVLRSGDKVVVNIERNQPSPPGIFILFDGIGLVAKQVEFLDGSDPPRVRISSSNPSYPPYERTVDEITIVGRVVGRWERL